MDRTTQIKIDTNSVKELIDEGIKRYIETYNINPTRIIINKDNYRKLLKECDKRIMMFYKGILIDIEE